MIGKPGVSLEPPERHHANIWGLSLTERTEPTSLCRTNVSLPFETQSEPLCNWLVLLTFSPVALIRVPREAGSRGEEVQAGSALVLKQQTLAWA